MSAADFIDTTIFVYAVDTAADAAKREAARTLLGRALDDGSAVISFQVVQETLNTITRKLRVVASEADAKEFLAAVLVPLWKVQPSAALYQRALAVQRHQRLAFCDSLIVAAALDAGCRRLLSEDLQHGQRVGTLRIENPFHALAGR